MGQPNARKSATTESEYLSRADFHEQIFNFEGTGTRALKALGYDDLEQRIWQTTAVDEQVLERES